MTIGCLIMFRRPKPLLNEGGYNTKQVANMVRLFIKKKLIIILQPETAYKTSGITAADHFFHIGFIVIHNRFHSQSAAVNALLNELCLVR